VVAQKALAKKPETHPGKRPQPEKPL
jgi:hypothetical protein